MLEKAGARLQPGGGVAAQGASRPRGRTAVTIRSLHTGRYWQVLGSDEGSEANRAGRLRLSASAPPDQRGHERTVFLLEREGESDADAGGWVLLRWLKTRQLVEAVPVGVPGREDDAWSVQLSVAGAVNELHKLAVEDDESHAQSHIWSYGLRGYLNVLEGSSEIVGHGDSMPPTPLSEPPARAAVAIEPLHSGAAWLMDALARRDRQIDVMADELTSARAELAALLARAPTPGRPVGLRERRGTGDGGDAADAAEVGGERPRVDHTSSEAESPSNPSKGGTSSTTSEAPSRQAAAGGGGVLAELRTATQRHPRVRVECPSGAVSAAPSALASGGGGGGGGEGESSVCARGRQSSSLMPSWSYMAHGEYARFVKGIASRLRLGSGDALLDLAEADCGGSSSAIQHLYRGRLNVLALLPSAAAVQQHMGSASLAPGARGGAHQSPVAMRSVPHAGLAVNACAASLTNLGWLPARAFEGAITFGALSALRTRRQLCDAFQAVLRSVVPGGRFIIADAEYPQRCPTPPPADKPAGRNGGMRGGVRGGVRGGMRGGDAPAVTTESDSLADGDAADGCSSCHWQTSAPLASFSACVPMDMAVSLSTVDHSELPGTATHECATRHFALIAQRASAQQQLSVTVEAGSDGGKVAVVLSLAATSGDGHLQRRVQFLKEASIDNKRMYCGLHGYSLLIGEDLQHWRDAGWDKVKLLSAQLSNYEWLLWVPVDSVFADSARSRLRPIDNPIRPQSAPNPPPIRPQSAPNPSHSASVGLNQPSIRPQSAPNPSHSASIGLNRPQYSM